MHKGNNTVSFLLLCLTVVSVGVSGLQTRSVSGLSSKTHSLDSEKLGSQTTMTTTSTEHASELSINVPSFPDVEVLPGTFVPDKDGSVSHTLAASPEDTRMAKMLSRLAYDPSHAQGSVVEYNRNYVHEVKLINDGGQSKMSPAAHTASSKKHASEESHKADARDVLFQHRLHTIAVNSKHDAIEWKKEFDHRSKLNVARAHEERAKQASLERKQVLEENKKQAQTLQMLQEENRKQLHNIEVERTQNQRRAELHKRMFISTKHKIEKDRVEAAKEDQTKDKNAAKWQATMDKKHKAAELREIAKTDKQIAKFKAENDKAFAQHSQRKHQAIDAATKSKLKISGQEQDQKHKIAQAVAAEDEHARPVHSKFQSSVIDARISEDRVKREVNAKNQAMFQHWNSVRSEQNNKLWRSYWGR